LATSDDDGYITHIQCTGVAMSFSVQKDIRPMHYDYVIRREERIRVTDLICSSYKVLAYFFPKESREWNTQGEMTSQNLWSRYARYFVGITWHKVLS